MQDKAEITALEQAEKLASLSPTTTNSQSKSTACANTNLGNIASSQAAPAAAAVPPPTGQIIDVADVRQYLKSWGCLAHAGVRALLDQAETVHAAPAAVAVPDGWKLVPLVPTLAMGWAYLDKAREVSPDGE